MALLESCEDSKSRHADRFPEKAIKVRNAGSPFYQANGRIHGRRSDNWYWLRCPSRYPRICEGPRIFPRTLRPETRRPHSHKRLHRAGSLSNPRLIVIGSFQDWHMAGLPDTTLRPQFNTHQRSVARTGRRITVRIRCWCPCRSGYDLLKMYDASHVQSFCCG